MSQPDLELEQRIASRLLDVLIRAGLILALTVLCYRVFAPFLGLMAGALVLAVMIYPLHQFVARRIGDRQGPAAALLVIAGIVLIAIPSIPLIGSLGELLPRLVGDIQNNALTIPAPRASLAQWPIVGEKLFAWWSMAHSDLPALIHNMQPQIGNLAKAALRFAGRLSVDLMLFFGSLVVAGIIMAFGEAGARGCCRIATRIVGPVRGPQLISLSTSTIRAVAIGVIGVALIQSILVGVALLIASVPWAGVLALIVFVLGVAQVPAGLVLLPSIAYLWMSGNYSIGESIGYSILLALTGLVDNVLKPLLLGRGVDAPMPIILIGALGGLASSGIGGLFLGATLLALGYKLFMGWVAQDPDAVGYRDNA